MHAIIFEHNHPHDHNMHAMDADLVPLSRVERKRQEARTRIVEAAAQLFRARGVDAVTIQEITAAADVGHGTFYLHFKTKTDVLLPIMVAEAAALDAKVQRHFPGPRDPAEVLATSSRYIASVIVRDALWRWFLRHSGVPGESMRAAFGRFSVRDFRAGLASGRFAAADPRTAATFCFGGYISVLLACIDAEDPQPMIDHAVETMLRVLGLNADEAADIAHRSIAHIL
jgi:AcrR family transcriptional regulator